MKTFSEHFSSLLDEIYNYSDAEAISFWGDLFPQIDDKEALELFALFRQMHEQKSKSSREAYKNAMSRLQKQYGEENDE